MRFILFITGLLFFVAAASAARPSSTAGPREVSYEPVGPPAQIQAASPEAVPITRTLNQGMAASRAYSNNASPNYVGTNGNRAVRINRRPGIFRRMGYRLGGWGNRFLGYMGFRPRFPAYRPPSNLINGQRGYRPPRRIDSNRIAIRPQRPQLIKEPVDYIKPPVKNVATETPMQTVCGPSAYNAETGESTPSLCTKVRSSQANCDIRIYDPGGGSSGGIGAMVVKDIENKSYNASSSALCSAQANLNVHRSWYCKEMKQGRFSAIIKHSTPHPRGGKRLTSNTRNYKCKNGKAVLVKSHTASLIEPPKTTTVYPMPVGPPVMMEDSVYAGSGTAAPQEVERAPSSDNSSNQMDSGYAPAQYSSGGSGDRGSRASFGSR